MVTKENTVVRARLLPRVISYRKHALNAGLQDLSHDDEMEVYCSVDSENGYWQQSLEIATQAIEIRKRVLGSHHQLTLDAMLGACRGYYMLGMLDETEQNAAEALTSNVRLNPVVAIYGISTPGRIYLDQNGLDQAEGLIDLVVEAETKLADSKSPAYSKAKNLLADIYAAQGKLELAQEVAADTLNDM